MNLFENLQVYKESKIPRKRNLREDVETNNKQLLTVKVLNVAPSSEGDEEQEREYRKMTKNEFNIDIIEYGDLDSNHGYEIFKASVDDAERYLREIYGYDFEDNNVKIIANKSLLKNNEIADDEIKLVNIEKLCKKELRQIVKELNKYFGTLNLIPVSSNSEYQKKLVYKHGKVKVSNINKDGLTNSTIYCIYEPVNDMSYQEFNNKYNKQWKNQQFSILQELMNKHNFEFNSELFKGWLCENHNVGDHGLLHMSFYLIKRF